MEGMATAPQVEKLAALGLKLSRAPDVAMLMDLLPPHLSYRGFGWDLRLRKLSWMRGGVGWSVAYENEPEYLDAAVSHKVEPRDLVTALADALIWAIEVAGYPAWRINAQDHAGYPWDGREGAA